MFERQWEGFLNTNQMQCYYNAQCHCIYIECGIHMPLILSKFLGVGGGSYGHWRQVDVRLDFPHISYFKVAIFSFVHGWGGPRTDSAVIRRCQGTCPKRLGLSPPSNPPYTHARFLQTQRRLSSRTTVLGGCPDGYLEEEKEYRLLIKF